MLSFALLTASMVASADCKAQGVVERAGEALDNAGRNIRRGVEGAVARGQAAAREMSVFERVYARIHWDKKLTDAVIELEVQSDGTTTLRGAVADAAAKKRAVILARDTVGVTTVVDELSIADAARVIPASPTKPTRVAPPTSTTTTTIEKKTVVKP
jgi:hyperosmotically inducible protein